MQDRLAAISVTSEPPAFCTLTLPDSAILDSYQGFGYQFRILCDNLRHWLDSLGKRLLRVCPDAAFLWRIESEVRKSGRFEGKRVPHLHLLVWNLPFEEWLDYIPRRRCDPGHGDPFVRRTHWVACQGAGAMWLQCQLLDGYASSPVQDFPRSSIDFRDWLSFAWFDVVGSGDFKHLQAGVSVEALRSHQGVCSYVSKYLAKPTDPDCEAMYGRCWGFVNRKCIPWAKLVTMDLPGDVGYRLRRVMRHFLQHRLGRKFTVRNGCGMTLYCDAAHWWTKLVRQSCPDPF